MLRRTTWNFEERCSSGQCHSGCGRGRKRGEGSRRGEEGEEDPRNFSRLPEKLMSLVVDGRAGATSLRTTEGRPQCECNGVRPSPLPHSHSSLTRSLSKSASIPHSLRWSVTLHYITTPTCWQPKNVPVPLGNGKNNSLRNRLPVGHVNPTPCHNNCGDGVS